MVTRTIHDDESPRQLSQESQQGYKQISTPSPSTIPKQPAQPNRSWSTSDFYFGRQIGQGIDGNVYHARWKTSQRSSHRTPFSALDDDLTVSSDIAIKVMDRNELLKTKRTSSVMTEKKILSRFTTDISSSWVIQLYMSFMDAQNLYLVLEFLPVSLSCMVHYFAESKSRKGGNTSDEHLGQLEEVCMDISSVQYYGGQVLCALEHLHSWGVIHRDLKPENILMTCKGRIKLIDFGSALDVNATGGGRNHETSGKLMFDFVGTADYVSPEVIKGNMAGMKEEEGRILPSTIDLWAYGCVIYFMFLGESPFHSESDSGAFCRVLAHANGMKRLVFPAILPSQASCLISKLLEDPTTRLGVMDKVTTLGEQYISVRSHHFFRGVNWADMKASSLTPLPSHSPNEMKLGDSRVGRMVDGSSLDFDFFS